MSGRDANQLDGYQPYVGRWPERDANQLGHSPTCASATGAPCDCGWQGLTVMERVILTERDETFELPPERDANQLAADVRALRTAIEYLLAGGLGRRDEIARLIEDSHSTEALVCTLQQERDEARLDALASSTEELRATTATLIETNQALATTRQALTRAVYLAQHLYQMIDKETWRAMGGDDGQGHYEGDYRAEQIGEELRALADTGDDTA